MTIVSPTLSNFLFEAANFLVLAAALGWFLFKPIRRTLDEERDRHARQERETAELRQEAERRAEEARAREAELETEMAGRRAELLADAEREAARIKDEARRARDRERQSFERELAGSREAQAAALAETIGHLASAAVRRLLEAIDGPDLEQALVRAACAKLEKLPESAARSAVVDSARPLGPDARRLLSEALGTDSIQERTDPELGAGVRITTSAGQIDGSALSFAREAARLVTEAATPVRHDDG